MGTGSARVEEDIFRTSTLTWKLVEDSVSHNAGIPMTTGLFFDISNEYRRLTKAWIIARTAPPSPSPASQQQTSQAYQPLSYLHN